METFGAAVDGGDDDDFLDQEPDDHQAGDDDSMHGDDDSLHQQQPGQEEEDEDYFMSDDDDDDDYMSAQGDDDEEEEHTFPVHAPPAAACEAAIAALEAADAPADDCCPVCLQDGDGEAPEPAARLWSRVAPCGHRFHAACVGSWLRVNLSCPVCRCPAAAAARRRDAAPPRPIPDIVEELLAMGYEESLVFDKSPRWMEFMADPHRHITWNSSWVS